MTIERVGVAFEPDILKKFDRLLKGSGYMSRSEALRDLARKAILDSEVKEGKGIVIGTITIIYDHHASNVTERLLDLQHHHHADVISTMHVHASEKMCLEVIVVRGESAEVRRLSDSIRAVKGVKHGELVITKTGL